MKYRRRGIGTCVVVVVVVVIALFTWWKGTQGG